MADVAALVVSDLEGENLTEPIIDSIKNGNFSTGGNIYFWEANSSAWQLGYSDLSETNTYTGWQLPTKDDLTAVKDYINNSSYNTNFPSGFVSPILNYAQYWSSSEIYTDPATIVPAPEVGDEMEGGVVFHVDAANNRAYVVAKSSMIYGSGYIDTAQWGSSDVPVDGALGTGYQNTEDIINHYGFGGYYTDWFLPSKDELYEIYTEISATGIDSFSSGNYWTSSSTNNPHTAYSLNMSNGEFGHTQKLTSLKSRAIRTTSYTADKDVGDYYEGGLIFYKSYSDNLTYIVSVEDLSSKQFAFGTNGLVYDTQIGKGYTNTLALSTIVGGDSVAVAALAYDYSSTATAAQICRDGSISWNSETYDDWYLPSRDEFNAIYLNLDDVEAVSGFQPLDNDMYWTSSSANYSSNGVPMAFQQHPLAGAQVAASVLTYNKVRGIRHFDYVVSLPSPKAWSMHMMIGANQTYKSQTHYVRPVKQVLISESEAIYNINDSLQGGVVVSRTVNSGTQNLLVVANTDAVDGPTDEWDWGCTNLHNSASTYTSLGSSSYNTQAIFDSCTSLNSAAAAAITHSEVVSTVLSNVYGLVSSNVTTPMIIIQYPNATYEFQDYTLNFTVANMTNSFTVSTSNDASPSTNYALNEVITSNDSYSFDFTELEMEGGRGKILFISDRGSSGDSNHFDGAITNVELLHRNVITNNTPELSIEFPTFQAPVDANSLSSAESSETQTLNFPAGWSMFSLWIDVDGAYAGDDASFSSGKDLMAVFNAQEDYEKIIIMKNNDGNAWLPIWSFNGIGDLVNGQGYQVKMTTAGSFTFTGNPIHSVVGENTMYGMQQMPLHGGWNMIGIPFPPGSDYSFEEMFSSHLYSPYNADSAGQLIIIKHYNGNAYLPAWSFNGIGDIEPGLGYLVKIKGVANDTWNIDATIEL